MTKLFQSCFLKKKFFKSKKFTIIETFPQSVFSLAAPPNVFDSVLIQTETHFLYFLAALDDKFIRLTHTHPLPFNTNNADCQSAEAPSAGPRLAYIPIPSWGPPRAPLNLLFLISSPFTPQILISCGAREEGYRSAPSRRWMGRSRRHQASTEHLGPGSDDVHSLRGGSSCAALS